MDPAGMAMGQAIGDMFADIAALRQQQRTREHIGSLDSALERVTARYRAMSGTARNVGACLGAVAGALERVDPGHPYFHNHAYRDAIQEAAQEPPHLRYWPSEAAQVGRDYPIPPRPASAPPCPLQTIQQLQGELSAQQRQIQELQQQLQQRTQQVNQLTQQVNRMTQEAEVSKERTSQGMQELVDKYVARVIAQRDRADAAMIDLVHHRAQRAVFRSELARIAPDHPMVTDATLRERVSKAAERTYVFGSIGGKEPIDSVWERVDKDALSEFERQARKTVSAQEHQAQESKLAAELADHERWNRILDNCAIDLVHHRGQRAVFRGELARLAPDHPMVTDAALRQAVSKAAEKTWLFETHKQGRITEETWTIADESAVREFEHRAAGLSGPQEAPLLATTQSDDA
jgi:hypothetical protein